jgi:hypothetical protein
VRAFVSTSIRRAPAIAATLLAAANAFAAAQPEEPSVRVTALSGPATITLGDQTFAPLGSEQPLFEDEALPVSVQGPQGRRQALLHVRSAGVSLLLDGLGVDLQARGDGGVSVRVNAGARGAVDVYHDRERPWTLITLPGAWIGLSRGAVRIRPAQAAGSFEIIVASGSAGVFAGQAPAGEAAGGQAQLVLDADGQNSVVLAADGTLSAPRRDDAIAAQLTADRRAVVQRSLLPELVRVAEAVAEGDIEPPTRGSRFAAVTVAPEVRIPEIVPRGGVAAILSAGARTVTVATVQSTAEAFLGSREAALAVVGARLERTRIIGNPATMRAPLSISRELRTPFLLGRDR